MTVRSSSELHELATRVLVGAGASLANAGFVADALIAAEIIVGTSGIGFLMFDARRAGSVVEILLGMIVLGLLWYIVDGWVLAPIERPAVYLGKLLALLLLKRND